LCWYFITFLNMGGLVVVQKRLWLWIGFHARPPIQ
jgi:hypothetical protein